MLPKYFTKYLWFIFISLILINNFLYQSIFQIDQRIFVALCFAILASILTIKRQVHIGFLIFVLIIGIVFAVSLFSLSYDLFYLNRSLMTVLASTTFLMTFFLSQDIIFPDFSFSFSLVITMCGALALLFFGVDRAELANVNWWPMTLFFTLAMSNQRNKLKWYILTFLMAHFGYASRGTSFSSIIAIITSFVSWFPIRKLFIKFYSYFFLVLVFLFMSFLAYYASHQEVVERFVAMSERGFAGREIAWIPGWNILEETHYIGKGIGTISSFEDSQSTLLNPKSVQIHFGFLDLSLKFSLYLATCLMIAISACIQNANITFFPGLAGGVMTIFYYNGFGISHYGLNLLLIMLLGMSISTSVTRRLSQRI
ncbi:MAG: hypothetical protein F6K31_02835 [Symploca sp. SIO2G7]|nr:hypothetical protein [Symploca sp. SIO2G7]